MTPLKVRIEFVLFRDIEESPLNAQEMSQGDFKRLVANIKQDGVLTTAPLLMDQQNKSKKLCVSGHHRIRAAIKAGLSGSNCMITEEVNESTRIRLQLAHNDIHGNPNEEIVKLLQKQLDDIDFNLIDIVGIDEKIKEAKSIEYEVPEFTYIQICLLEESRSALVDLIMSLEKSDSERWLIEHPDYEKLKDILTIAFRAGFKTPGRAFRKFLDIIEANKELIQ